MATEAGASGITLELSMDVPCPDNPEGGHDYSGTLGCADHAYKHLWGHYCIHCYDQAFYSDLTYMCERRKASGIVHICGPQCKRNWWQRILDKVKL